MTSVAPLVQSLALLSGCCPFLGSVGHPSVIQKRKTIAADAAAASQRGANRAPSASSHDADGPRRFFQRR